MSWDTAVVLGVLAVMGANQLVMRVGALHARWYVFYFLQLTNIATGSAVITLGLPGFEPWPVVSWIIGLLFFFRSVQNNNLRVAWLRESRAPARTELMERAEALRQAVERAEARQEEEDG